MELVEYIGRNPDQRLPSDTVERAIAALDAWLARDLDDTDDDWMPYLERLETAHGVRLEEAEDLATVFEAHALDELQRWSPSPPDLTELISYAKRFNLDDLAHVLEEKAREDDRREEMHDEESHRRRETQPPAGRSRRISDEELDRMFSRLAP